MSQQGQFFPTGVSQIGMLATIGDDGLFHVRTALRVDPLHVEHAATEYSICTDDELHTLLIALLGALMVRAEHLRALTRFQLDERPF